jgi:hypothetical protein
VEHVEEAEIGRHQASAGLKRLVTSSDAPKAFNTGRVMEFSFFFG